MKKIRTFIRRYIKPIRIVFAGTAIFLGYLSIYKNRALDIFQDKELSILEYIGLGQNIDFYIENLGHPKFINKNVFSGDNDYVYQKETMCGQGIFEKKKYFLEAMVDKDNIVQYYAITAKEPITLKVLGDKIKLCKTKFSNIKKDYGYQGQGGYLSNRNAHYFEIYGGDGVTNYTEHIFAFNSISNCGSFDSSVFDIMSPLYSTYRSLNGSSETEILNKRYRETSKITTYGISSMDYNLYKHFDYLDFGGLHSQIIFGIEPPKWEGNFIGKTL